MADKLMNISNNYKQNYPFRKVNELENVITGLFPLSLSLSLDIPPFEVITIKTSLLILTLKA